MVPMARRFVPVVEEQTVAEVDHSVIAVVGGTWTPFVARA